MPYTYAHYRMGQEVLKQLSCPVREIIMENKELYDIGLHGPDILFYYHPLKVNRVNSIGYGLHEHSGKYFFERAALVIKKSSDAKAALAYTFGFISHFTLDATSHGYIDEKIAESGVSHAEIEVEFDRSLMEEDGLDPIRHELTGHIIPSMKNAELIAPFFTGTNPKQIEKALMGMIHYNHLLLAPSVFKRMFIYMLLHLTGNYKEMHGLLVNFEANPACHDSTQKLKQLYTLAAERTVRLINEYSDYLAFWGYAASAVTIIVALIGPVFGTLADTQGLKKPIFTITMLIGVLGCLALGFSRHWIAFLLIYIIAKTGFFGSLVFYDSMLGDVTTKDRMDDVSSQRYAWGYIGSCVPFIVCLGVVLGAGWIGISTEMAMMISFVIVAVWWIAATIPLLKSYKQKHYITRQPKGASFLGTIVISLVSQLTGQVNIGVGAISLFFILGMIVFKMSTAEAGSM